MNKCQIKENVKMLECSNKHTQQQVYLILLDKNLVGAERLACQQCIVNGIGSFNGISLMQGISKIQLLKDQIFDEICIQFDQNHKQLLSFTNEIVQFKEILLMTIDKILDHINNWIEGLKILKDEYAQYRLLDEIDNLTKPSEQLIELEKQKFQQSVKNLRNDYWTKTGKEIEYLENYIKEYLQFLKFNQLQDPTINKESLQNKQIVFKEQQQNNSYQVIINQFNEYERVEHQLIHEVQQEPKCRALDFNKDNSLIAASCDKNINIWKFNEGQLINQGIVLTGHEDNVLCIVFSRRINWFVSGEKKNQIRCWIEKINNQGQTQWESSAPLTQHTSYILCLHLNQCEDELISGSGDFTINIWKVKCNQNKIEFQYSLHKHEGYVDKVDLNQKETQMVSCGRDAKIFLWEKGGNNKWEFKSIIQQSTQSPGIRIGFLQNDTIVWCQYKQPFLHVFKQENGTFQERLDLQVQLKNIIPENKNKDQNLFQLKYLEQQKVLTFKSNRYIYFMKYSSNSNLKFLCDPIDCESIDCYGNITNNGRYLVIWNKKQLKFQIYKISYY